MTKMLKKKEIKNDADITNEIKNNISNNATHDTKNNNRDDEKSDKKTDFSRKIFVLDTNVLVHDPDVIHQFKGVEIGIPSVVLEELDTFKKEGTDRGRNAREVIRNIDALRVRGSLHNGVPLDNGSVVKVLFLQKEPAFLPFKLNIEDNKILLTALALKQQGYQVTFVSKDINARIKGDALGLPVEDYLKEKNFVTEQDFYKGWIALPVPAVQLKTEFPPVLNEVLKSGILALNQYVIVESQHNPNNYKLFQYLGGDKFRELLKSPIKWPLQPRNVQQLMALDLLCDNRIKFVTLFGPAGTGKTFLALLAGLYQVLVEHEFKKMLISRPVVPLGRDVGYLPGELKEKLHNWMLPIYDNMDFLIHSIGLQTDTGNHAALDTYNQKNDYKKNKYGKHKHEKNRYEKDKHETFKHSGILPLEQLINQDKVSLEAITYMRGRSIPYQFILIDEAQNLTPHEIKTIITRVGEGSKIVLAGDPYQIDSPYLDFSSNGLVTSSEKFKGQKIFGCVYLETSERSELSKLAGELL